MESDWLLSAQGLARDYGGRRVVADIELRLAAGDVLGVLGPNGAGKTTILRMLAGTLAPSAGRVAIAGADLADNPRAAKRHLGYLPERPPVYPELTVDEYLRFAARLHGLPRARRAAAIEAAKIDCGLTDVGRRLIGALSKGYAQRVGLAQAIVHRPDVLILDEPTAGLDPSQLIGVRALIGRLSREHSVIISSHILGEIQAVASHIVIVDRGRLALSASRAELAADASWLEIGLAHGPDAATLAALPDVADVREAGNGRWLIRPTDGHDIRVALAEHAVAHGWGLQMLAARPTSLEERFMRVISAGDDTGRAAS
ncbi:ABC transporter ATP-binding protein [Salinisphaera sp. LB1]|uniref:ABC transporter ATP-binding protein n=1 Tax=Salinisphaera sp. LB1 TaxID=2183911 RepID=UPI000D708747|nr:ABC transporter ATP-binding protein [Salinisphaera sp. LB1]AWN16322.1 ABC-type multidrug transport system, ATPase component [Salinisphaera sp. LB1]